MTGRVCFLLFAVLLSGCTPYKMQPPGRAEIEGVYAVDSQILWSQVDQDRVTLWTVNGPFLESVRFIKVGSGQALIAQDEDEQHPRFEPDMRASEVLEFVADSMTAFGSNDLRTSQLRPAKFGAADGFRFNLQFLTQDGLLMKGMALGATIDHELHLILYTAPATYYYEKYEATVEAIFGSVELI